MKILVLSPLFPPDIATPAPYVKQLAERLSPHHSVTLLIYGHLPESVAGVTIKTVDKRAASWLRIMRFWWQLLTLSREHDVIYAQNGASIELPLLLVSYLRKTPIIIRFADQAARTQAAENIWRTRLEGAVISRATHVIYPSTPATMTQADIVLPDPPEKPEILPFDEPPTGALAEYQTAWQTHLTTLNHLFDHAH